MVGGIVWCACTVCITACAVQVYLNPSKGNSPIFLSIPSDSLRSMATSEAAKWEGTGMSSSEAEKHEEQVVDYKPAFWECMKRSMTKALRDDPVLLRKLGDGIRSGSRPAAGKKF